MLLKIDSSARFDIFVLPALFYLVYVSYGIALAFRIEKNSKLMTMGLYMVHWLDGTKPAINVEHTIVGILILGEEDRRIGHFSRISESM